MFVLIFNQRNFNDAVYLGSTSIFAMPKLRIYSCYSNLTDSKEQFLPIGAKGPLYLYCHLFLEFSLDFLDKSRIKKQH